MELFENKNLDQVFSLNEMNNVLKSTIIFYFLFFSGIDEIHE